MRLICCLPRYEPTNEEILARVKSVAVLQQTQAQVWAALVKRCFCISGSNSKLNWFIQGKAATTEPLWSGTWSWCFPCHCSDRHTRPGRKFLTFYERKPKQTPQLLPWLIWSLKGEPSGGSILTGEIFMRADNPADCNNQIIHTTIIINRCYLWWSSRPSL